MSPLCSNIIPDIPSKIGCDENYVHRPIHEFIRQTIEAHERVFPDYRFDRLEIEYKDGRYLATPHFKHKDAL